MKTSSTLTLKENLNKSMSQQHGEKSPEEPRQRNEKKRKKRRKETLVQLFASPYCALYICATCGLDLCTEDEIISRSFFSSSGRAYLMDHIVNIKVSEEKEERNFMTGLHQVADISCQGCSTILGWKYEVAYHDNQKYKEGKYVIEKLRLVSSQGY